MITNKKRNNKHKRRHLVAPLYGYVQGPLKFNVFNVTLLLDLIALISTIQLREQIRMKLCHIIENCIPSYYPHKPFVKLG